MNGFLTGYLAYMFLTLVFAVVTCLRASRRADLSGSTHYAFCVIVCYYDFWVGGYYDVRTHRVYLFPIPFVGMMVDCDFNASVED